MRYSRRAAGCSPSAVLVLTGLGDEHRGIEAVAAGAQDYLVKGLVDGQLLSRAIRYAIERRRTEEQSASSTHLRARGENARLERGLLPIPLVDDTVRSLRTTARAGPALLGGDFYDLVQDRDGTVHALIGDVSGHGPDEAALGVAADRLAGVGARRRRRTRRTATLHELLVAERALGRGVRHRGDGRCPPRRRHAGLRWPATPAAAGRGTGSPPRCPRSGAGPRRDRRRDWPATEVRLPARWRSCCTPTA